MDSLEHRVCRRTRRTAIERNVLCNSAFLPAYTATRLGRDRRRMHTAAILLPLPGIRRLRVFLENAVEIALAYRGPRIEVRVDYVRHPWVGETDPLRKPLDRTVVAIPDVLDPTWSRHRAISLLAETE